MNGTKLDRAWTRWQKSIARVNLLRERLAGARGRLADDRRAYRQAEKEHSRETSRNFDNALKASGVTFPTTPAAACRPNGRRKAHGSPIVTGNG